MRNVVVGKNSFLWQKLSQRDDVKGADFVALGHSELSAFEFRRDDRVWLFSYSKREDENNRMIDFLISARVSSIVYLGSSSSIVVEVTNCYQYPRVKADAESRVLESPIGFSVVLGMVVHCDDELPGGTSVVTTIDELAEFLLSPTWPSDESHRRLLFRQVVRPFSSMTERKLYSAYGHMMAKVGAFPCVLRPIDFLLRSLNFRWYGYTYLGNRLWKSSMTS